MIEIIDGTLLRVFVNERDRHEGILLSEWIVRKARDQGIAGASVYRAIEGFGAHAKIHNARILDLADNLPIVIEVIDSTEKIAALLPYIDGAVSEGLCTTQPLSIRRYRSEK